MKLFGLFASLCLILSACAVETEKIIWVEPGKTITSSYIGNGVQWSAYPHADAPDAEWGPIMTQEKWDMVFKRLDYMKPQLVRVMDQANWRYLEGFDKKGKPVLDFESPEMKSLYKLLDYCQKNEISVLIGEWGCPFQMHDSAVNTLGSFKGANDPEWIAIIVKLLDNLINTKGYSCIKYYNLVNEPNGYWASTMGDWDEWSEGIRILDSALVASGLNNKISIAGPDAVTQYDNPDSKYTGVEWVVQSGLQLNKYLGIYDIHAYTNYDLVRSGRFTKEYGDIARIAKDLNKPIIFGEIGFDKSTPENIERIKTDTFASEDSQMSVYDFSYGVDMADVAIQIMKAGYSGAAAWSLDDAMHTLGDEGDKFKLKRWGFWNSLGTELCGNPEDENIRPWFYTWSLLCRYFPAGINIIESDSTGIEGVRLVAASKGSDMTIAVVNNSTASQTFTMMIDGTASWKPFKKFIYSEEYRPVDKNFFPVAAEIDIVSTNSKMVVEIPAKSFLLYTSFAY